MTTVGVFTGTIEGNIAAGIDRWIDKNPELLAKADAMSAKAFEQLVYELMDAEAWLESAHTEGTTFAYICSHDPRQMFCLAFQITMLRCELKGDE